MVSFCARVCREGCRCRSHLSMPQGRLLHYFPPDEAGGSEDWCAWHLDHGSITGEPSPGLHQNGKFLMEWQTSTINTCTNSNSMSQSTVDSRCETAVLAAIGTMNVCGAQHGATKEMPFRAS